MLINFFLLDSRYCYGKIAKNSGGEKLDYILAKLFPILMVLYGINLYS